MLTPGTVLYEALLHKLETRISSKIDAYIKEGAGVFRMHPSRSTMQTVNAWSWDAAEKELVEQHTELYRILAAASGKVRKQCEMGVLSPLDGVSFEHAPAPGLDIGPVGTDEDRTSEDECEAEAEDADNDAKEEEVDAAGKDALSSLLSLGDDSEYDVDITVASSLLSLADADDADNDNKDDADDARGATARARTSSLSLSSTATETATATAAAIPCATASSRGLMHPPAARPRPPLASLPLSLVASSVPSMSAPKQRRSLPSFITNSTRASSGPLPAPVSSRSTDASASSTDVKAPSRLRALTPAPTRRPSIRNKSTSSHAR